MQIAERKEHWQIVKHFSSVRKLHVEVFLWEISICTVRCWQMFWVRDSFYQLNIWPLSMVWSPLYMEQTAPVKHRLIMDGLQIRLETQSYFRFLSLALGRIMREDRVQYVCSMILCSSGSLFEETLIATSFHLMKHPICYMRISTLQNSKLFSNKLLYWRNHTQFEHC